MFCNRSHGWRESIAVIPVAAVVMGANGCLEHSGHDSRPAGRADRACRKRVPVEDTFRCESVDMRRVDYRFSITSQIRADIFGKDQQDVRSIQGGRGRPSATGPGSEKGDSRGQTDQELTSIHHTHFFTPYALSNRTGERSQGTAPASII